MLGRHELGNRIFQGATADIQHDVSQACTLSAEPTWYATLTLTVLDTVPAKTKNMNTETKLLRLEYKG